MAAAAAVRRRLEALGRRRGRAGAGLDARRIGSGGRAGPAVRGGSAAGRERRAGADGSASAARNGQWTAAVWPAVAAGGDSALAARRPPRPTALRAASACATAALDRQPARGLPPCATAWSHARRSVDILRLRLDDALQRVSAGARCAPITQTTIGNTNGTATSRIAEEENLHVPRPSYTAPLLRFSLSLRLATHLTRIDGRCSASLIARRRLRPS